MVGRRTKLRRFLRYSVGTSTTSRKSLEDTIFFVKNVKDEWSSIREYINDKYSPVAAQAWDRIEEKYKVYGWPWKSYCTCSERWRGLTKRYKVVLLSQTLSNSEYVLVNCLCVPSCKNTYFVAFYACILNM